MPSADSHNGNQPRLPNGASDARSGASGGTANGSDRLTGWKEIANYIGKGVRTAQRWEQQFGLPVHRIGGEVVFALRSEIDAWSTSKSGQRGQNGALNIPADANGDAEDGADTGPARLTDRLRALAVKRPHVAALVIALAGVLLTVIAWISVSAIWRSSATMAPIADVRLAGNRLEALDADKRVLWSQPFDEIQNPDRAANRKTLIITDLTGDGAPEILYVAADDQAGQRLVVFNNDGKVRFQHQWSGPVRFGSVDYHGPFQALWVWVTNPPEGHPIIWLSSRHRVEFPSVLERLDSTGNVTGAYWQGGEVTALATDRIAGRDLVLVGGVANEGHGASLAIFDADRFGGTAPGPDAAHTCDTCLAGRPLRFYIIPRDEVGDLIHAESDVWTIATQADGGFTVVVKHRHLAESSVGGPLHAFTDYTFGANLAPERADYVYEYRVFHDELFKKGLVDHDFAGHDKSLLFPIKEWKDGKFVEVWPKDRGRGPGAGGQLGRRSPNPAP